MAHDVKGSQVPDLSAQMEWSATVGNFTFVSVPLVTSSSVFTEISREQNGIFLPS